MSPMQERPPARLQQCHRSCQCGRSGARDARGFSALPQFAQSQFPGHVIYRRFLIQYREGGRRLHQTARAQAAAEPPVWMGWKWREAAQGATLWRRSAALRVAVRRQRGVMALFAYFKKPKGEAEGPKPSAAGASASAAKGADKSKALAPSGESPARGRAKAGKAVNAGTKKSALATPSPQLSGAGSRGGARGEWRSAGRAALRAFEEGAAC